jgi:hypothetical protein
MVVGLSILLSFSIDIYTVEVADERVSGWLDVGVSAYGRDV